MATKELLTNFIGRGEVRGFEFRLCIANPRAFVYEVSDHGTKHWEVFTRKIDTRFDKIRYPNAKAFGEWAWSFYNLDRAMAKFNELSKP